MKIFNYNNFLSKINEDVTGPLHKMEYLKSFRKILWRMKSPIAKEVLSLNGKDLPVQYNFVGISENKDDTISFIAPNRAKNTKIIYKTHPNSHNNAGQYTHSALTGLFNLDPNARVNIIPPSTSVTIEEEASRESLLKSHNAILRNFAVDTLKNPSCGMALIKTLDGQYQCSVIRSFLEETDETTTKTRQELKVGRFVKRLLLIANLEFQDKEIEEFVNEFKSQILISRDVWRLFEMVEGEKIKYWYLADHYNEEKTATLQQSCMRYQKCQEFFNIYTKNPDVCKLLILRNEDDPEKINGRALVWKLSDGTIFMDRIYFTNDSEIKLFKEYAMKHSWCYKRDQSSKDNPIIEFNNENKYTKFVIVKLEKCDFEFYPYMDTLKYFFKKPGIISSSEFYEKSHFDYKMELTNGVLENECDVCNGEGYINCPECDGRGDTTCPHCDGDGSVDCPECDGKRKIECEHCNGEGEVDCPDCDGTGKDENGKDCESCKGTGKRDCPDCNGRGKVSCPRCLGDKRIECDRCDGSGFIPCGNCEDGRVICPECDGNG